MKRPSLALFAALSLVDATSAVAQTDDPNTAQCVEAYVHGQELQKVHKLVEARNEYRVCSQTSCKDFIVKDCSMWLDTVQESLPAVVPIAIDDADNAISQAKVLMDGAELVARIDGRSVEVDPGLHTFTFEAPDGRKVDRIVLVPEGDKGVRVLVVLPRPPVEDPPRPQTPALLVPEVEPSGTTGGSSMSSSGSLWTVALWASGATAVSATAVGGAFGVAYQSNRNAANQNCARAGCSAAGLADIQRAKADGWVADTLFAAAGAALIGGAVTAVFFRPVRQPAALWTPAIGPLTGGGAAVELAHDW